MVRVYSQSTLPLRADTVVIEKVGGNAFFKLKDSSRNTAGGILTNIGNGVYVGKRPRMSGDTLFIGRDTFTVSTSSGLNVYNTDSTLAGDRTILQAGRYLRFSDGIDYTQFNGALQTIQPDSSATPFYVRVIKSPYAGTPADGMLEWREGLGHADQSPSRPNYPYMRGWNLAAGGSAYVSGLPAMGESWEPHYLTDPSSPTLWLMEYHKYLITKLGVQLRAESWTWNTRDNDYNVYYTVPQWALRDSLTSDYLFAGTSYRSDRTSTLTLKSGNGATEMQFVANGTANMATLNSISAGQFKFVGFTDIDFGNSNTYSVSTNQWGIENMYQNTNLIRNSQTTSAFNFKNSNAGGAEAAFIINGNTGEFRNFVGASYFPTWYTNNTEAMRLTTAGELRVNSLDTDATPPTTSGTTKMVITDANGQLSFDDIPSGGGNIQQVLDVGDTTRRPIMYKWDADTTDDAYVHYSFPSNFGVDYGTFGTGMGFSSGWNRANGVNPSGRPNVVYNLLQYNTTNGGGRINTNEAAFRFGAETNFDLGPGPAFEIHMPEIVTKSGTYLRPMSLYIDKNTGSTAYNYLATGGMLYQTVAGDDLMSFNANGNYNFVGHGSGSTLSLFDESLAGVRYQLQVDGTDVFHNSFGNLQRFDGQIYSAQTTNNPSIYLDDSRTTNNTSGLFMNMNSPNAKRPIHITGAVTNGMESFFENTTGNSVIKISSPTDPVLQMINTSPTDPGGTGYNGAYFSTTAGNGAASGHFGVFYGNSNLGDLDESAIVINGSSLPITLNNSFTEKARLSTGGAWLINRKTAIGTEKLSVNGGVNVNKDNITYRTSTGSRHMLVIDTATGDFERMTATIGNLATDNLTQDAEARIYDANNQNLTFNNVADYNTISRGTITGRTTYAQYRMLPSSSGAMLTIAASMMNAAALADSIKSTINFINGGIHQSVANSSSTTSYMSMTETTININPGTSLNIKATGNSGASVDSLLAVGTMNTGGSDVYGTNPVYKIPMQKFFKGTTNWTPGVVAAGSSTSTSFTVTGASVGDPVTVSKLAAYSNGEMYDAFVSATNTVTIRVHNVSTGSANYSSASNYNVVVIKY